jgi:class 3 adenylate cyclase
MMIKSANTTCCKKSLQLSLTVDMMIRFATLVNPGYDIYKRLGLKEGMPIPNQNAAERIVTDMVQDGFYIDFVETLIQADSKGYMGRRYKLSGLDGVVAGLIDEGYTYDKVTGQFFENQRERISPNWGRLHEGDERKVTVLRLDIVGNSELVKTNPQTKIKQAYSDIRNIVSHAVNSRIGRLWSWEGDGALAAFLFGPMERMAIYAGMEILHEVFFYNRLRNPLDKPFNLRLGAHVGQVRYSNSEMERLKNETVKEAMVLESLAKINSLGVSYNLYITMDQHILDLFGAEKTGRSCKYRLYTVGHEK